MPRQPVRQQHERDQCRKTELLRLPQLRVASTPAQPSILPLGVLKIAPDAGDPVVQDKLSEKFILRADTALAERFNVVLSFIIIRRLFLPISHPGITF